MKQEYNLDTRGNTILVFGEHGGYIELDIENARSLAFDLLNTVHSINEMHVEGYANDDEEVCPCANCKGAKCGK